MYKRPIRQCALMVFALLAMVFGLTAPAFAQERPLQRGWPPVLAVGQTWRVDISGAGSWTVRLTGKDSDGDPVGTATGTPNYAAFFYYIQKDDLAVLEMLDANGGGRACAFGRDSVRGEGLVGTGLSRANKNEKYQQNGTCTATLQTNTPAPSPTPPPAPGPALTWPPNFALGQQWRLELVGYGNTTVRLTENDRFGSPSGKATLGNTNYSISFYFSRSTETAAVELNDANGGTLACRFKGPNSVVGQGLQRGEIVARSNAQSPFAVQQGTCAAALQNGQTPQPSPTPPSPTPPSPTPPPPSNVNLGWPPVVPLGTTWTLEVKNQGSWSIKFLNPDRDGDPTGPATGLAGAANGDAVFYYNKNDNDARLEVQAGRNRVLCIFEREDIQGTTLRGWRYESTSDNKLRKTSDACLMQAAPASLGGGASTVVLTWPPKIEVGQTWTYQIDGLGTWTSTLEKLNGDGDPMGQAKGNPNFTAVMYYYDKNNRVELGFYDNSNTLVYACLFEQKGMVGNALKGSAYKGTGGGKIENLNRNCTATLGPNAGGGGLLGGGTSVNPNTSSTTLVWPIKPQLGQTWSVTLAQGNNGLSWRGALKDFNGELAFTATASDNTTADVFLAHDDKNNLFLAFVETDALTIACGFTRATMRGNSVATTDVFAKKSGEKDFVGLNGYTCTATLEQVAALLRMPSVNPAQHLLVRF